MFGFFILFYNFPSFQLGKKPHHPSCLLENSGYMFLISCVYVSRQELKRKCTALHMSLPGGWKAEYLMLRLEVEKITRNNRKVETIMSDFLMCYNRVSFHLAQVNSQLSLAWTYTGIRAGCSLHRCRVGVA